VSYSLWLCPRCGKRAALSVRDRAAACKLCLDTWMHRIGYVISCGDFKLKVEDDL
jgi:hypothetical protein